MNPNWKGLELNYNELPKATHYRFAEIEITRAIPILAMFDDRAQRHELLYREIFRIIQKANYLMEHEEEWITTTYTPYFRNATKEELAIYFRYRNISYKTIRSVTGMSPNTIAKVQYASVNHFPQYRRWDDDMLANWNIIKSGLNLWKEELLQNKL